MFGATIIFFKSCFRKIAKKLILDNDPQQSVKTAETAIQQINLTYNPEQDRLLMRIGLSDNTEVAVWLTYRVVRQIWMLLQGDSKVVGNYPPQTMQADLASNPQEAVKIFEQETKIAQSLQKLDFATAYQPRNQMRHDSILLATQCQIRTLENQANLLELTCSNGLNINMNLNQDFVLAVCNMLQIATKEAAWNLGMASVGSKPEAPRQSGTPPKTLH